MEVEPWFFLETATESHEILVNVFPDKAPSYATAKMVLKIRDGRDSHKDDTWSGSLHKILHDYLVMSKNYRQNNQWAKWNVLDH